MSNQIKYLRLLFVLLGIFNYFSFVVCSAESQEPNNPIMLRLTTGREIPGSFFMARLPSGSFNRLLVYKGILFASSFTEGYVAFYNIKDKVLVNRVEMEEFERDVTYDSSGSESEALSKEKRRYSAGDLAIAGDKLFVAQVFSDFILVIDIETGKIIHRLPIGGEGKLVSSPSGDKLYYASNLENVFNIIEPFTYKYETIPFPTGGRGIGSIAISPNDRLLYLGIQRGGIAADNKQHGNGNTFLAVYDLEEQRYIVSIYLARIGERFTEDDSVASYILPTDDGNLLYVGMFQSIAGIQVIDTKKMELIGNISFVPNKNNKYFKWVDPLSLAFYKDYLISFNRNNAELAIMDRRTNYILATLDFGMELTSGASIVIDDGTAFVTSPEFKAILVIDMNKLIKEIFETK